MSAKNRTKKTAVEPETKLIEQMDEELMETVDGSDVERVVNELLARGGADAALAIMLWRAVVDYFVVVEPESCG